MNKEDIITVRLSKQACIEINTICEKYGENISSIIRRLIAEKYSEIIKQGKENERKL